MSTATNSHPAASAEPDASQRFVALYQEYARLLLAFLQAQLGQEADANDVSQTVWNNVYRKLDQFDGNNFRAWLFQIARNAVIDHRRKNFGKPKSLNDEDVSVDPTEEDCDMNDQLEDRKRAMRHCLEKLSPEFREAVQARLAGKSYDEISASTGIAPNTWMTRFGRAKTQLRECVERTLS